VVHAGAHDRTAGTGDGLMRGMRLVVPPRRAPLASDAMPTRPPWRAFA